MKSLIVLAALVAFTMAEADLQSCVKEAKGFGGCIFKAVNESAHKNMDQFKPLKEALEKCFDLAAVKDKCKKPTPPARPTPSAEQVACFTGAKTAFQTCFRKSAGLPEDFKFEEGEHHPPPFAMHHHFAPHNLEEAKALALKMCNNDAAAAQALEDCGKDAVKANAQTLKAAGPPKNPLLEVCNAGKACAASNPISADCKPKLAEGRKALCACKGEFKNFLEKSTECASVRADFEKHRAEHEAAAKSAEHSAAGLHDHPQHPHGEFDICAENQHQNHDHAKFCENVQNGRPFFTTTKAPSK